jgi:tetratricopeptide (TPR) repeat protein
LFDYVLLAAYGAGEDDQARFLASQAVDAGTLRLVPHVIDALARAEDTTQFAQRTRQWVGEPEFAFIETSLTFAEMGLHRDAAALLEAATWAAVPEGSRRPLPGYYMAYFHHERGDADEARHWLEQARAARGERVFPSRPEAIAVLQFAVEQEPTDARAWLYLGNLYAGLGRHDEAREAWTTAAAADPQLSVAARNLGVDAWRLRGDLEAATEWLQRAIAARPLDQTLYRDLGRVLTARGLTDNALSVLESVPVAAADRRADVTLDLARSYVVLERYDDAVALLESTTFTQREGDTGTRAIFYDAHLARGIRRFEDFDHGGALADFEAALTYPVNLNVGRPHRPREARAQYWRGMALDALGRVEQAGDAWSACAEGAPLDDEQREYIALCAERVGR